MPDFTPNLNLYKPGGGSTGLIQPDEVADIDRLNQNFDLIDDFAGGWGDPDKFTRHHRGPASALGSVAGMQLGDTYQETDGNKVFWRFDGSNWITNEGGLYLIRPTSVTNGAVNEKGEVVPTAGTNGNANPLRIDGAFSARFRSYRLQFMYQTTANTGSSIQFCSAGTDHSGPNYNYQQFHSSSTSSSSARGLSSTQIPIAATSADMQYGQMDLFSVVAGVAKPFWGKFGGSSLSLAEITGYLGNAPGDSLEATGITFKLSSAANWKDPSWFKLYGMV